MELIFDFQFTSKHHSQQNMRKRKINQKKKKRAMQNGKKMVSGFSKKYT